MEQLKPKSAVGSASETSIANAALNPVVGSQATSLSSPSSSSSGIKFIRLDRLRHVGDDERALDGSTLHDAVLSICTRGFPTLAPQPVRSVSE